MIYMYYYFEAFIFMLCCWYDATCKLQVNNLPPGRGKIV